MHETSSQELSDWMIYLQIQSDKEEDDPPADPNQAAEAFIAALKASGHQVIEKGKE